MSQETLAARGGGCELCGCPSRDTIKKVDGQMRVVCFGCAGPIQTRKNSWRGAELDGIEREVEVVRRQEDEAARRDIEEPPEPRPPPERLWKCVECGDALEDKQRKRCAPCAEEHRLSWRRRYQRNHWAARHRLAAR